MCSGCMTCIPLCPYKAISHDTERKIAVIDAALCKGCGTCVAACPSAPPNNTCSPTDKSTKSWKGC